LGDASAITTDEDLIVRLLYGALKPFVLGVDFVRAWNCDSGTCMNLVRANVLRTVPGTDYGRGRGLTPCITWDSAISFLQSRRIG